MLPPLLCCNEELPPEHLSDSSWDFPNEETTLPRTLFESFSNCQTSEKKNDAETLWQGIPQHHIQKVHFPLSEDSIEWFMLKSSFEFFLFLKDLAWEEGICRIEILNKRKFTGIIVNGIHPRIVLGIIENILQNPPRKYFVQKKRTYEKKFQIILKQFFITKGMLH